MLNILDHLPARLLELEAWQLHEVLPGPTLIHLPGRRPSPLFVAVLQHGNEDVGWCALRSLLRKYRDQELPRALSFFVANVEAARHRQRFLDHQLDYNRSWQGPLAGEARPEHRILQQVVDEMRQRGTFISVDVHNNTGINPHYACINRIDHRFFHLATLFSRTVVYFTKPDGVQSKVFAEFCPAVTLECGQPGKQQGNDHAQTYLEACLHLAELPSHPVASHDIDLFHTVAIAKVPTDISFGFGQGNCDIHFVDDLDHLNFRELPAGTTLGWINKQCESPLDVRDEQGREVGQRYFQIAEGQIRTRIPVMPSMLTLDANAIRKDCLGYLMERYQPFYGGVEGPAIAEASQLESAG